MFDPPLAKRDGEVVQVRQSTYLTSDKTVATDEIFFIKGQKT